MVEPERATGLEHQKRDTAKTHAPNVKDNARPKPLHPPRAATPLLLIRSASNGLCARQRRLAILSQRVSHGHACGGRGG
jgi:hypothetical protein